MKLIESSYEILPFNHKALQRLELIGRISHLSHSTIEDEEESAERFVSARKKEGHDTIMEFDDITVVFTCDRAFSHELVRHRLLSFMQESQRYCNYSKGKFNAEITFIRPWWLHEGDKGYEDFVKSCQNAEDAYFDLLNDGWTPEQARGVLPNATKTVIAAKGNLREWHHVLKLRTDITAHPDIRKEMTYLCMELKQLIPVVFDDIKLYPPFTLWEGDRTNGD